MMTKDLSDAAWAAMIPTASREYLMGLAIAGVYSRLEEMTIEELRDYLLGLTTETKADPPKGGFRCGNCHWWGLYFSGAADGETWAICAKPQPESCGAGGHPKRHEGDWCQRWTQRGCGKQRDPHKPIGHNPEYVPMRNGQKRKGLMAASWLTVRFSITPEDDMTTDTPDRDKLSGYPCSVFTNTGMCHADCHAAPMCQELPIYRAHIKLRDDMRKLTAERDAYKAVTACYIDSDQTPREKAAHINGWVRTLGMGSSNAAIAWDALADVVAKLGNP